MLNITKAIILQVLMKTTLGEIDIELWSKETPKACRNFVQLCMEGYYDETVFHRVVKGMYRKEIMVLQQNCLNFLHPG